MASIAVDSGTSTGRAIRVGSLTVSQVAFAQHARLAWHAHPRACVAVVVDGAVEKRFSTMATDAAVGTVVFMPPEEPHEDRFGSQGSSIVVVESDNGLDRVASFQDWQALLIALRIARELAVGDRFSALAVEGLALELCAVAGRACSPSPVQSWVLDAQALLSERFLQVPTVAEIATELGVHPARLARSFRAHYRESLGEHARRLRLEWAAAQLMRTDVELVSLAADAGFVDQSHFTRAFRKHFGITPAKYRAAFR